MGCRRLQHLIGLNGRGHTELTYSLVSVQPVGNHCRVQAEAYTTGFIHDRAVLVAQMEVMFVRLGDPW